MAAASRFWVFWIRNTIRKVTMVVPVLITSCQVSLNRNTGPVSAQTSTTATQMMKVHGRPAILAVALARWLNSFSIPAERRPLGRVPPDQKPPQSAFCGARAPMVRSRKSR